MHVLGSKSVGNSLKRN